MTSPIQPVTTPASGYVHISARSTQHRAARGLVLYVNMDESAASTTDTSLRRLATELRHSVESVVPGAAASAAVVIAPAGTPGTDLEVVRQVLENSTIPPGTAPTLAPAPVAVDTDRPEAVIDLPRRQMRLDGELLNLTNKEFEILHYLMEHRNRAVGRDELLDRLWRNAHYVPSERTIDVHIRQLRTRLGRLGGTVRTVHGKGYRFHEHPQITIWTASQHNP